MNTPVASSSDRKRRASRAAGPAGDALDDTVRRVCARIAPTWPLDRFIAVNPFWGLIDSPLSDVAAKLASLSGARLLMPRAWYRLAYREGRLRDDHLAAALEETGSTESVESLRSLLEHDEPAGSTRCRVVDVLDAARDLGHQPSWSGFVTQSISQMCAAHFDGGQARFRPSRDGGLYASWRRYAQGDRSPSLLMGARTYRTRARDLPEHARDLITIALAELGVESRHHEDYLWSLLLDVNGWASWCAYRRWSARLQGDDDEAITELLAIRLAWEWILYGTGGDVMAQRWNAAMRAWPRIDAAAVAARARDWLLQTAMEIAWREPVVRALPAGFHVPRPTHAQVQAVFCIDVRSEVFRRALEATAPTVQTLGAAGFFGLPIDYQPVGASAARPQLPGLLAPRLRVANTAVNAGADARRRRHIDLIANWHGFKTDPVATFTFVEALGVTYAAQLAAASLGLLGQPSDERVGLPRDVEHRRRPRLVGAVDGEPLDADARSDLALGMLRAMSLTRDFARLVLLVGHGSETRNNPHAAGLHCGACGGQTGEVNARAAVALLNDPEIRAGLARRGVTIAESTWFVAALHNTTTDEVELFELDTLPPSHRGDVDTLQSWLAAAGARTRAERAARLGIEHRDASAIDGAIRHRARDWAQVRAEWGLVDNAGFIVAPRERCRHLDLQGRSFLYDYRHEEDDGYAVLEMIMTAPMVVTHWINFQYYASTVDNVRYGSGNKVLHNVVGGHLGVFEGNGGDLRIGLPLQSLHDGTRWVHTPLRLSVFIEAPRSAIVTIVNRHETVRHLVRNGWLSLFQLDPEEGAVYALRAMQWHRHRAVPARSAAET